MLKGENTGKRLAAEGTPSSSTLGGHPNPAIEGQLKTGHRE